MQPQYTGRITSEDLDALTKKLSEFAATLGEKEQHVLMGVLELAGKASEDTSQTRTPKKTLNLRRENIRELNVWQRLLETQEISLWTCNRPDKPGDPVINPR
jgi:hypothetical protein